jgi:hypothetical protein
MLGRFFDMPNIRIFSRVTVCSADIRTSKFEFLGHASQLIRIERNATVTLQLIFGDRYGARQGSVVHKSFKLGR